MSPPLSAAAGRVAFALAWLRGAAATCRLALVYLAVVAGVSSPVVVGTVTGAFWLWGRVSLGPVAGCLCFLAIGAVVMVEFTLPRPLVDAAGMLILRPDAE